MSFSLNSYRTYFRHGSSSFGPGKTSTPHFPGYSNPNTQAHTHARNAVLETRKANPVAASEEHDLAAGEFATATQSSSDHEVSLD